MAKVVAEQVRYIKLGPGNAWATEALAKGHLPFGDIHDMHDLGLQKNWSAQEAVYVRDKGVIPGKAKSFAREMRDFYTLGPDCLWVSFAKGRLWWAFADTEIISANEPGSALGMRFRKTIGGWKDTDILGRTLRLTELSTRLTKVAAYRQTICTVKEQHYLLRRLNGEDEPAVAEARSAKTTLVTAIQSLIALLHQSDFELMVDLMFARSGWRRVSVLGRNQADVDLELEQPASGERAFVQVKSSAAQTVVEDYLRRFDEDGTYDRFFFVCHSPEGALSPSDRPNVHIWTSARLAEIVIEAGLVDWLIEKNA